MGNTTQALNGYARQTAGNLLIGELQSVGGTNSNGY